MHRVRREGQRKRVAPHAQNYETVILHYINKQEYNLALNRLTDIQDKGERDALMIRNASVFMKNEPIKTLKVLRKEEFKKINYAKLVPAFMDVDRRYTDEMLDFILVSHARLTPQDICIKRDKCKDKTVYNLVFYFHT